MHDSGGADTCGCEMLITSAVAIVFSCPVWDTYSLRVPCFIGRASGTLVMKKRYRLRQRVTSQRLVRKYGVSQPKVPLSANPIGRAKNCPAASSDYILPTQASDATAARFD